MLQDSLSKIKYFLVLAVLLIIPIRAMAGDGAPFGLDFIDQTDTGADRLIYAYDTVGRETYIQVTNTSDGFVSIHVQVFRAQDGCAKDDFEYCLTPGDTQVWNVENFPGSPDLSLSHGFVSISIDNDSPISGCDDNPDDSIIGMFRIISDAGYEYRTNAANSESESGFPQIYDVLNFNDVSGNNLSDVIGITFVDLGSSQVTASPLIGTLFGTVFSDEQNLIFDEFEGANSCSPVFFSCGDTTINYGIDNSIPNSQGFGSICNTSRLSEANSAGWLYLPFIDYVCVDADGNSVGCDDFVDFIHFVGFLGLNNGDGSGSMDSWMAVSPRGLLLD